MINYLLNLSIIETCIDIITNNISFNISRHNIKKGDKYKQLISYNTAMKTIYFYDITIIDITNSSILFNYERFNEKAYYYKYNTYKYTKIMYNTGRFTSYIGHDRYILV